MDRTHTTRRPAFSMMELVIVMVIMGILAAIAIPRIGTASDRAKAEAVEASLSQVRSSIEIYKAEHLGSIPGMEFVAQMTQYSNEQGMTDTSLSSKFPLGPYLREIPKNPYSGSNAVRFIMTASPTQAASSKNLGWTYNVVTGEFAADCSDTQLTVDVQAMPLNKL
jgi:prepilin-type N-terminal cleavage/methylation domain-containing protein